jgi:hypothetical protein
MTTSTIDELRLAVAFHREALAVAETQLYDLECPPETRRIPQEVMRNRVLAMETRKAYKSPWKKAVERGLAENVEHILNDCADYLCDNEENPLDFSAAAKERLGRANSLQRQEFTLLVIQYLKHKGSFYTEDTSDVDDFEDTSGGCDEITQDAAMYLIENPGWHV